MHLHRLDLNLLVVFNAIYREGNITRASQQLNLTQPAVSHALARLRDALQDPLFIRQGTQMLPTPYARNLIGPIQQALSLLTQSLNHETVFNPINTARLFYLGLRDVLEATALPPLLTHLQQAAPLFEIASVRVDRHDLEAELTAGTLDLALEVPLAMSEQIRQMPILHERQVVVARANHAGLKQGLTLDSYLAQQHVLVSSRRKGWGLEDFELNRIGQRRHIALRCQHYFAACRVVSETDLLLTMPEQYARIANAQFANELYAFPVATPDLNMHLYWHVNAEKDPANCWLREILVSLLRELSGNLIELS